VIECGPTPRALVAKVHVPDAKVQVPTGMAGLPSMKVTLPVGIVPVTLAVRVTEPPDVDGLGLLVSDVAVAA